MSPIRTALYLIFSGLAAAQQYTISTIIGGAPPPTPVPATTASLFMPTAVATDAAGNVYFVASYCVFKLDASGVMTRIAGNGRPGYSGDGGLAINVQIFPTTSSGLAVDAQGNVFLPDRARIRKISPSGTITTFAGSGVAGSSGDGGPATSAKLDQPDGLAIDGRGNLLFADDNRIRS